MSENINEKNAILSCNGGKNFKIAGVEQEFADRLAKIIDNKFQTNIFTLFEKGKIYKPEEIIKIFMIYHSFIGEEKTYEELKSYLRLDKYSENDEIEIIKYGSSPESREYIQLKINGEDSSIKFSFLGEIY